jgi:hypothetical protein
LDVTAATLSVAREGPLVTECRHLALGREIAPRVGERKGTMPFIEIVIVLIIVGVLLSLVNRYIQMASSIRTILNVFVIVVVCVWVLQAMGVWGEVSSFRLRR